MLAILGSMIALLHLSSAATGIFGPLLDYNLGDTCIVKDGDPYYAFATNHYDQSGINVPGAMSLSSDIRGQWKPLSKSQDLLPNGPGAWALQGSKAQCGSPDVSQLPDGSWILYYAANPVDQGNNTSSNLKHCIGIARSSKAQGILGPYTPSKNVWICSEGGKGSGFQGPNYYHDVSTNEYYVVYKNGSSFDVDNGGVSEIWLQQVKADGESHVGHPTKLVSSTNTGNEQGDAEGPALVKNPQNGNYVLFYSGGIFSKLSYHIEYASASNIRGPYTPHAGVLLLGSSPPVYEGYNLTAPGGTDFIGSSAVDFTFISQANRNFTGGRRLYTGTLQYNGDNITLNGT